MHSLFGSPSHENAAGGKWPDNAAHSGRVGPCWVYPGFSLPPYPSLFSLPPGIFLLSSVPCARFRAAAEGRFFCCYAGTNCLGGRSLINFFMFDLCSKSKSFLSPLGRLQAPCGALIAVVGSADRCFVGFGLVFYIFFFALILKAGFRYPPPPFRQRRSGSLFNA